MEKLITDILSKKELRNLDRKIVQDELRKYFVKHKEAKKKLEEKNYNNRSETYKKTVKEIRKKLREIFGVFIQKDYSKKEKLLSKLTKNNQEEIIYELLKLHQSTKERIPFYKDIYEKIRNITGKQKIILDLGCGLNPLSYEFLGYKPKYIASDLSSKDLEFIGKFFEKTKVNGETIRIDLINEKNKLKNLKTDLCFLFKALDSLEARKKDISKELIEKINSKWIILSFSKVSLGGGKKITKTKRKWMVDFIKNKGYFYKEFEVLNEYFVVVKKG